MLGCIFQRLLLLLLLSLASAAEPEVEVVMPQEVTVDDIPLQLGWRGRSRRGHRSLHPGKTRADSLYVHMEASGMDLYMRLQRSLKFLAPGFVVEEKGPGDQVKPSQIALNQSCFYTGHVLTQNNSFVSLNACGGLVVPAIFEF